MEWPLSYIIKCELLHAAFGLLVLALYASFWVVSLSISTTYLEVGSGLTKRQAFWLRLSVLGLGLHLFSLAWLIHILADKMNLGF